MPTRLFRALVGTWLALLLGVVGAAHAEQARLLVKLRVEPAGAVPELGALAARSGAKLLATRHITGGIHFVRLDLGQPVGRTLAQLRADPRVAYAELDERRYPLATPDDPLFDGQWYLQADQASAIDAVDAWAMTTGSNGLVIAALDTGVRFDHPDLRGGSANRLLPGYDMISNVETGNTGLGRNPDASDPGDWVTSADTKTALFASCAVGNSSWHGTRVSGILGAISNNGAGIAGVTWSGWVLPVRVLGKCGGYDSDILAAMVWAAGFPVDGAPANPYPARIINMSLGASGACPQSYQETVDEVTRAGVLVVVSAGNEGGSVDAPANCAGVVAVAGLRQVGTKVGYSSLGPEIALSAPAGNCVNTGAGEPCLFSIATTTNSGTTVPATNTYTDEYNFSVGTSFSAPIVAGIAGLMLSVNGNLSPAQLTERLQLGATAPFPAPAGLPVCHVPTGSQNPQTAECTCTTAVCGAGMANANGAVLQALRPIAAVSLPAKVTPGATLMLNGSGSTAACGAQVASFAWSVVVPAGAPPPKNADSAQVSVTAPTGAGVMQLMLTVTDDAGRSDSALVVLTSSSASSAAPALGGSSACLTPVSYTPTATGASGGSSTPAGGGGGGGGTLEWLTLCAMAVLAARRYASRSAASSHSRCALR